MLKREPDHVEAICTLGRLLLSEERQVEALEAYAELLDVLERRGFRPSREQPPT